MRTIMVGIGEWQVSKTPGDVIKTLALGSCVGVIVWAREQRAAGLLHVALPDSTIDLERARQRPGSFADTGIPLLLEDMAELGCYQRGLIVKLAGGASIMAPNQTFDIGKRNLLAIRKVLWTYGLGPIAEDVGGNISRSVAVRVDVGRVVLSSPGRGRWEL